MRNVTVSFLSTLYYRCLRPNLSESVFSSDRDFLFKQEKAVLSKKSGLVLPILWHIYSSILITEFTMVKTHFESVPNTFYETCSERNAAIVTEYFTKIVQLHNLLLARSQSLVAF